MSGAEAILEDTNFTEIENFHILIQVSLKTVPQGPTDNKSAFSDVLIQVMSTFRPVAYLATSHHRNRLLKMQNPGSPNGPAMVDVRLSSWWSIN